jgi:lysozyme
MKTGARGLDLIKRCEGWVPTVYKCQAGHDTVGFGHLVTVAEEKAQTFARGLTLEEGEALLARDVARFEAAVGRLVDVRLTQNQFDALVSFVFNVGVAAFTRSTLLKKINAGDLDLRAEFMRWTQAREPRTGRMAELPGLKARRKAEADLWESPPVEPVV